MADDELRRRMEQEAGRLEQRERRRERSRETDREREARKERSDPRGLRALIHMTTGQSLGSLLFFWALTWVLAAGAIGTGVFEDSLLIGLLVGVPVALPLPVILLVGLVRWRTYRHWREDLGFEMEGGIDELAADRRGEEYWREAEIAVELGAREPEPVEAVHAALRLFCARANDRIYEVPAGCVETIQRWTVQGSICRGDANLPMAWDVVRLIGSDLCALAKAGVPIDRVVLWVSDNARSIPRKPDPDPASLST